MIEISFDFKGHRYGVKRNKQTNQISYFCDYHPISRNEFAEVLGRSQHDTHDWRHRLGIK